MSHEIKSVKVKCPKCETKIIISRHKQDFCSNCGMELDYAQLKKRWKVGKKLVIIFIIVIGLALLMLAFFPELLWFIVGLIAMIGIAFLVVIVLGVYLQSGTLVG